MELCDSSLSSRAFQSLSKTSLFDRLVFFRRILNVINLWTMGDSFPAFKSFPVILDVFVGRYASTWFVVDRCGIDIYIWLLWIDVGRFGWFRVLVTTLFTCNQFKCLHDEDN